MSSIKVFLQEEELVLALKHKKNIGMRALLDMYSASLLDILNGFVKDPSLSEDALQEVMMKIWNGIDKYDRTKGRLSTWILNVTRNYAIDTIRSKWYKDQMNTMYTTGCNTFLDNLYHMNYNIDTIDVKQLMYNLDSKYNSVLDMAYIKGYTHVEIAKLLNLPPGTVKTRIRMALSELRKGFD